jgi:hypothetical protein
MKFYSSMAALAAGLSFFVIHGVVAGQQPPALGHTAGLAIKILTPAMAGKLTVTSPAFSDGGEIPYENTQYRGNIFPGLTWTAGPV